MNRDVGNKNTIELNGQVYDALTGKLLKPETAPRRANKPVTADGFVKAKASASGKQSQAPKPSKPVSEAKRSPTKPPGHQPSRSTTLMRTAVKKPGKRPIDQIQAPASSKPAKHVKATPIAERLSINERRLAHAQQTGQSRLISRFKPLNANRSVAKLEPLPLKKPAPAKPQAKTARISPSSRLDNILSAGLARATSHQQPAPDVKSQHHHKQKTFKRKWLIIISVIVIVLAGGGLVAAHFHGKIEFNIAEMQSGVHITLPTYQPTGFKLSKSTNNGSESLTVNYADKTTGLQFYVTAQDSSWDSQTLLDNVVLPASAHYQTHVQTGRTIYLYGPGAATWVNGGIWYQIGGTANLSNSQLIAIATSM